MTPTSKASKARALKTNIATKLARSVATAIFAVMAFAMLTATPASAQRGYYICSNGAKLMADIGRNRRNAEVHIDGMKGNIKLSRPSTMGPFTGKGYKLFPKGNIATLARPKGKPLRCIFEEPKPAPPVTAKPAKPKPAPDKVAKATPNKPAKSAKPKAKPAKPAKPVKPAKPPMRSVERKPATPTPDRRARATPPEKRQPRFQTPRAPDNRGADIRDKDARPGDRDRDNDNNNDTQNNTSRDPSPRSAARLVRTIDCEIARGIAEQTICREPRLARLDGQLWRLHTRLLRSIRERFAKRMIRRQHGRWITYRNSCGGGVECLTRAYQDRIAELNEDFTNDRRDPRFRRDFDGPRDRFDRDFDDPRDRFNRGFDDDRFGQQRRGRTARLCRGERGLRSRGQNRSTEFILRNRARGPIRLYWIDYRGIRVPYATIQPGESYRQRTFLRHPWVVVRRGACVRIIMPGQSERVVIVR